MTGFVTFDFDTSGVSGTFLLRTLGDIFVSLTSGVYSVNSQTTFMSQPGSYITLTDGAITGWAFDFRAGFPGGGICDFSFGPPTCAFSSAAPSCFMCFPPNGDLVQQISTGVV
jgi:hypothetical protein